jgi:hypothetical protein
MMLRELNLCGVKVRGYRAQMGSMVARVVGILLACAAALAGPSVASAAPNAAVGGIRSPAADDLVLSVQAVSDTGLTTAAATLNGTTVATASFPPGACRSDSGAECPAVVTLTIKTKEFADGMYRLEIVVRDEAGEEFRRLEDIEIYNNRPKSNPTVVVEIGSGTSNPNPSPPGGPVRPGDAPVCRSPRLSVFLDQPPLRIRRGVPVLRAGRKYRFEGRLTCVRNGRRGPAERGTIVQVRHRLGGFTIAKPALEVGRNGRVSARLSFRSSRVLVFRVVAATGKVTRVRIPVRVVRRR